MAYYCIHHLLTVMQMQLIIDVILSNHGIASWLLIRSRDMVGHPAPPEAEAAPEGSGEPVPAR